MALSKKVKIADLKANLSRHLRSVRAGEPITVMDRDTPVAMLVAYGDKAGSSLEVRPPTIDARKLASTRSPLKKPAAKKSPFSPSSLEILTELRGDR